MSPYTLLVGSWDDAVFTLSFDPSASPPSLKLVSELKVGYHPSWLAQHPTDSSLVFTAQRLSDTTSGEIVALRYTGPGSGVKEIGRSKNGGVDPCHLLVTEDEVVTANYKEGGVAVTPISTSRPYLFPDGAYQLDMPFYAPGPNRIRQAGSHAHQIVPSSDRAELLVPDLGADRTWRLGKKDGRWAVLEESIKYEPGSGPRHVVLLDGKLYTLLEITSRLATHAFPSGTSLSKSISTLTSPPPASSGAVMVAAELLAPLLNSTFPTQHLYVSNRDDPSPEGDTIAIFALDAEHDGVPVLVNEVRTGLRHARGMVFGGPDDLYLAVGGKDGGGVKIFERVDGGTRLKELAQIEEGIRSPTHFLWM
ncbi:3-carboxy-cis,cis-mucoante lactonizing enzyme [Coniophora puteana RWD-64-598 SS2]|uniref:3-carboxy-cis,cis-mucoante lactonizing enzyme n=1 Tax=Coniophora puteana (strain RWD-64-598) TaxID=741705 RepID=A0A5M3MN82_CONPW|nr:3-carboxy-cis,cis-mucoante lactonizing enzyme [Coniophora puteana RWD-64-598 SS2]EIW80175.1 3-carboxy-cis,cis-mucoante lactonizing enzyme [Coniophora puteana RWD-64-598 SS2]